MIFDIDYLAIRSNFDLCLVSLDNANSLYGGEPILSRMGELNVVL